MKRILIGLVVAAIWACTSSAQTTVKSNTVTVRNSAPQNVWFTFPSTTNVHEVQLGCSNSPVNHNWVFVTEEVNYYPTTYPFQVTVTCISSDDGDSDGSDTFTLAEAITVTTPDHTITIQPSTTWTVVLATGRSGYYWKAESGSSTITVQ